MRRLLPVIKIPVEIDNYGWAQYYKLQEIVGSLPAAVVDPKPAAVEDPKPEKKGRTFLPLKE